VKADFIFCLSWIS